MTTSKSRVYICYWDCNGFECIVDMTSWENQSLLDTIAGKPLKNPPVHLNALTLRAKFNPQRNPEIWTFNTDYEMTEEDLWRYADENPQALVDLIREKGQKIYGYAQREPVIK
jgi:hypothetical protein